MTFNAAIPRAFAPPPFPGPPALEDRGLAGVGCVETLHTGLASSSPLHLGQAIADQLLPALAEHDCDHLFFFSEPQVFACHGQALLDRLRSAHPCTLHLLDSGDSCKRMVCLEEVLEGLIAAGASKRSILIAFGGGAPSAIWWVWRQLCSFVACATSKSPPP